VSVLSPISVRVKRTKVLNPEFPLPAIPKAAWPPLVRKTIGPVLLLLVQVQS